MNLAKINEVIKASPAIQIQSRISLLQRRAWNVLLANAYNELPHKDIHSVSMVELSAKLGFDSGNQEYLKEVLKSIVDCTVEWNLLNKDNKQVWGAASLLAFVEVENGICCYQFPHPLRQKLYSPRVYAKLNLRLQNQFTRKYALILWELCFDYFDTDRDQGETPFIPLETFRELMGIEVDEYPAFSIFNRAVIKPAIKEINTVTDYHIEVEQKRLKRKVSELKFRITKLKQLPIQESVFPDIENLPPVAIELVQAQIDRNVALKIAAQEWDFVVPEKLSPPGTYPDFLSYVSEKIEMSLHAAAVKNRPGFIVEAIRENYQDPELQKQRQQRAEKLKEKRLEDLMAEFRAKRATLIRQAVHAQPELVAQAAERIQSYIIRERLNEHASVMEVYQKGGMVKAEIDGILAEEFCQDILAPVVAVYEDEKARILAESPCTKQR
ncbi:MAG: replication initiation protein [Candidatus Poribacteria bacterium]|nr:replication initiation protein [Candidatus Poribacteria bacterium]